MFTYKVCNQGNRVFTIQEDDMDVGETLCDFVLQGECEFPFLS